MQFGEAGGGAAAAVAVGAGGCGRGEKADAASFGAVLLRTRIRDDLTLACFKSIGSHKGLLKGNR